MKIMFALMATFLATHTASAASACGAQEAQNFAVATDRFNVGELSRADVEQAAYEFYTAMYKCEVFTKSGYCVVAKSSLIQIVAGIKEEFSVGRRSKEDLDMANKKLQDFNDFCR